VIPISVLVATRRRPEFLQRMAESLVEHADDPQSFEILLAFDTDDTHSLDAFAKSSVAGKCRWRAIVVPRMGYSRMHEYLNLLAKQATGHWLLVLGDDAYVKTTGWDTLILSSPCDRIYNTCNTSDVEYSRNALMHFVLPTDWVRAMGRLSPYQQSDTYLTALGNLVGRIELGWLFEIGHVAEGAQPSERVDDEVTNEIRYANNLNDYHPQLIADAQALVRLYSDPPRPTHRDEFPAYLNTRGLTGTAVEVGVAEGKYAARFLSEWRGRQYVMVDQWKHIDGYNDPMNGPDAEHEERYSQAMRVANDHDGRVLVMRMDSVAAAATFEDKSLDFVYIDGDHSFEGAVRDIQAWGPKVKPGGILAGHDYVHSDLFGVRRAVAGFGGPCGITHEQSPTWWVYVG
jgi:hypothetical protein